MEEDATFCEKFAENDFDFWTAAQDRTENHNCWPWLDTRCLLKSIVHVGVSKVMAIRLK